MKLNYNLPFYQVQIDVDFDQNATICFTFLETTERREYRIEGKFQGTDFEDDFIRLYTEECFVDFSFTAEGSLNGDVYDFNEEWVDSIANYNFIESIFCGNFAVVADDEWEYYEDFQEACVAFEYHQETCDDIQLLRFDFETEEYEMIDYFYVEY